MSFSSLRHLMKSLASPFLAELLLVGKAEAVTLRRPLKLQRLQRLLCFVLSRLLTLRRWKAVTKWIYSSDWNVFRDLCNC